MKMPPCKDCEFRHPGCHGSCEQYKAWALELEAERKAISKHHEADGFRAENVLKTRKRTNKR